MEYQPNFHAYNVRGLNRDSWEGLVVAAQALTNRAVMYSGREDLTK